MVKRIERDKKEKRVDSPVLLWLQVLWSERFSLWWSCKYLSSSHFCFCYCHRVISCGVGWKDKRERKKKNIEKHRMFLIIFDKKRSLITETESFFWNTFCLYLVHSIGFWTAFAFRPGNEKWKKSVNLLLL